MKNYSLDFSMYRLKKLVIGQRKIYETRSIFSTRKVDYENLKKNKINTIVKLIKNLKHANRL